MKGYMFVILGLSGLLSGCLAADCSYYTMQQRMSDCVTIDTTLTSIPEIKEEFQRYCRNMDTNIACHDAAFGQDCRDHYNAVGNRVAISVFCANVDHAVHALSECMLGEPTCDTNFNRSYVSATQRYMSTGDIGQYREDVCHAYPTFARSCFPIPITPSCPAAYSEFAADLFELSLAGTMCTDRDMTALFNKYGFTANGVPIPGRRHDVPIKDAPYTTKPDKPLLYEKDDMVSEQMHPTDALGHGMAAHVHRHITMFSHDRKPNGGSHSQVSIMCLLLTLCASFRFYFAI